jgi:DNA polymerase III sliding clamp (beta) subunit (PCNA family)
MENKIRLNTLELNKILFCSKNIVEKISTIDALKYILIQQLENGKYLLTTTNLEITLNFTLQLTEGGFDNNNKSFCINFSNFFNFISQIQDTDFILSNKDNKIIIQTSTSTLSLPKFDTSTFPTQALEENINYSNISCSEFINTTTKSLPFSSIDETRYNLNGLFVSNSHIVATDGISIIETKFSELEQNTSFKGGIIISNKVIPIINKIIQTFKPKSLDVGATKNFIYFKIDDIFTLSCRTVDGNFPDYTKVIDKNRQNSCIVKVNKEHYSSLIGILGRLRNITPDTAKTVKLIISTTHRSLTFSVSNNETSTSLTEKANYLDIRGARDLDLELYISVDYLIRTIHSLKDEPFFELQLAKDKFAPINIVANNSFIVIMPMRVG